MIPAKTKNDPGKPGRMATARQAFIGWFLSDRCPVVPQVRCSARVVEEPAGAALAVNRMGGRVEQQLIEREVQPAAEFEADLG